MTRAPELISIIIPALNRASVIGLQLDALAGQRTSRPFEVIVADNGSTDETVAVAESYADRFTRFEVVDAGALRGASYARNQGARRARGELLVFCDSDDIVHDAWLETMASAWRPGSIVAGRIYPLRLAPNAPRCDDLLPATPRPVTRGFLPFADGGNLAISRHDLERVGGWEDSFHFSEDVELSWRAQQSGLDLIDAPDAVVFKQGAPKGWIRFRQYYRWGRNGALLYSRYRDQGMPRRPARTVARSWAAVGLHTVRGTSDAKHRDLAVRQAGWYTGQLAGSLRYRVLYL